MQQTNDINPAPLRLVRLPEVMKKTGLAKCTIYRDVARGSFPRFCKAGGATLWSESEVDQWIAARLSERSSQRVAA